MAIQSSAARITFGCFAVLSDNGVNALKADRDYQRLATSGLVDLVKSLSADGAGFRPDAPWHVKLFGFWLRRSVVVDELRRARLELLEALLNTDQVWARDPASIQAICQPQFHRYLWMRYDQLRVEALFASARALFREPAFRTIVNRNSMISPGDRARHYNRIQDEIDSLRIETLSQILFGSQYVLPGASKQAYYLQHGERMRQEVVNGVQGPAGGAA